MHVVFEWRVVDDTKRLVRLHVLPDGLGQFEHGGRLCGRQVEVFVERLGTLQCHSDPAGQVATVGVMPDLSAVAEDPERVLAFGHLLDEVGDDVAHRQFDVAAEDVDVANGPSLTRSHTVEGPHDRKWQPVLVVSGSGEVFDGQLLESV